MTQHGIGCTLAIACLAALAGLAHGGARPKLTFVPPDRPGDIKPMSARIQRPMTLMATSTPRKRHHVRVLFYGQSITRQHWTRDVADHLRKTYPHADLEIENRARGGHTAPALIHTADFDLYPFYPDLLVFQVYGGDDSGELEEIVARVRRRTTAQILIWTPHLRWPHDLPRDVPPDDPRAKKSRRGDDHHADRLREIAAKHGCALADSRVQWEKYLAQHGLAPKDMLADGIHLNGLGCKLLAALVKPYLRYDPDVPGATWDKLVRDVPADGKLTLTFDGNRIDAIAAHTKDEKLGTAKVLVDGKPPSQFPELYAFTGSTKMFGHYWPAIKWMDSKARLLVEDWTARVTKVDLEGDRFHYELVGSKTGPDGTGVSDKRFVSNSGRVVLERRSWTLRVRNFRTKEPLPVGYEVKWSVVPLFTDIYTPPKTDDAAKEYATTLAQGLSNGRHTLEVVPTGDGAVPIAAFRVYRPPLK